MRLGRKPIRKPRDKRPRISGEELLNYVRENDFRTVRQLYRGRKLGEPKRYDYVREFGSWAKAKEKAFGRDPKVAFDLEYVLKSVIEFNIWTQARYFAIHKARPDVIPSSRFIRDKFGTFGNLFYMARSRSLVATLNRFVALKKALGCNPSIDDCRQAGLSLEPAVKMFGGKHKLDKFISSLEKNDEKQRGSD
jgi:hypothetical protein